MNANTGDRQRLDELIRRRLHAVVRDIDGARRGNRRALHRTRVASRRLRAALPLLELALSAEAVSEARRKVRRLTRLLGRVRELDVALGVLEEDRDASPLRRRVVDRVCAVVTRRRARLRDAMLDSLRKLAPDRLVSDLSRQLTADLHAAPAIDWRLRLTEQIARRVGRLRGTVEEAGVLFAPQRLHDVRIALKKLRYAMELANELEVLRSPRVLATLKQGQDLLGRLHDLDVVSALVADVRDDTPSGETADELDALRADLETEARRLHGRFVAGRPRLLRVARAIEASVAGMRRLEVQCRVGSPRPAVSASGRLVG